MASALKKTLDGLAHLAIPLLFVSAGIFIALDEPWIAIFTLIVGAIAFEDETRRAKPPASAPRGQVTMQVSVNPSTSWDGESVNAAIDEAFDEMKHALHRLR